MRRARLQRLARDHEHQTEEEGGRREPPAAPRERWCDLWVSRLSLFLNTPARLAWALDEGLCPHNFVCDTAAAEGSLAALQWARSRGLPWDEQTTANAAQRGHPPVLEWAVDHGCPVGSRAIMHLARRGDLRLLRKLRLAEVEQRTGDPSSTRESDSSKESVDSGDHRGQATPPPSTSPSPQWDITATAAAAEGGHLEVLEWLREQGCPWDASACAKAAEGGHLGVLQWARRNGCPWDTGLCEQ